MYSLILVAVLLIGLFQSAELFAQRPAAPRAASVQAVYTDTPPEIGNGIEAEIWEQGATIEGFTQILPFTGKPSGEKTVVRLLYDTQNVYVLFLCMDSQPDKIVSTTMARDEDLRNDDNVEIFFNSLNDNRTVFYFQTNPLSARRDAYVGSVGSVREEWDGVWQVKSGKFSQGWYAEFAIPLETLRFRKNGDFTWKVNFGREIRRLGETSYWNPIPISQRRSGKYQPRFYGTMSGMDRTVEAPTSLDIIPYVTAGTQRDYDPKEKETVKEFGADLKYGITSQLALDLTYNTDFAQIENDDEQINLTRYSLFFPEKRDFFMEGAGIFEMGRMGLTTPSGRVLPPEFLLFYSRQIGLSNGQPVPIIGGGRLTGRIGNYEVGVLNMVTDDANVTTPGGAPVEVNKTNYTVTRVKRDLFSRSSIGAMFLNKSISGDSHYNRAFGVDTRLALGGNATMSGMIMKTWTPGLKGKDWAGYGSFRYNNSWTDFSFESRFFNENFNPEMGYVRRPNTWSQNVRIAPYYRPNGKFIREISNFNVMTLVTDTDRNLITRQFRVGARINGTRNDLLEILYVPLLDHLSRDFRIRSLGVTVPQGDYQHNSWQLSLNSDPGRLLSWNIKSDLGDYYNGKMKTLSNEAAYNGFGRLILSLKYEKGWFEFPEETLAGRKMDTSLFGSRVIWSFSPDLSLKVFTQYNNTENRISNNILLRYIFMPGSDIFFVYNEGWDTFGPTTDIATRTAAVKIAYRW